MAKDLNTALCIEDFLTVVYDIFCLYIIDKWKIKTKKLPTFHLCTWFWNVVHVGVNLLELETTQQQNNPCAY